MNFTASIANSLWLAASVPALARFRRALQRPAESQSRLLHKYLRQHAGSAYGRRYGFDRIQSYEMFARQVPVVDYDALEPWITRICRGENHVLTCETVSHLVPTSGSSGPRKLIPFTAGLQREFNRAIGPWIADLYRLHPALAFGPGYWSITPMTPAPDAEPSIVPVGFDDDSAYLGGVRKRLVNAAMVRPVELREVNDLEQFRYLTLLCLLRQEDLRLISVWHPSFLSLLLEVLPANHENLLRDIHDGTCRYAGSLPEHVRAALKLRARSRRARQLHRADPSQPETFWPRLQVISCWGDGNAELARADLQRRFPATVIQSKGLLATEAFVTIPFAGFRPLAVASHFFEFLDAHGDVRLAHELHLNETYEVIVTTGGGLWRYRLQDEVRVTGFVGRTPSLQFLGRKGNVSDRFGEKLSETFVAQTLARVIAGRLPAPKFMLLAPDENGLGCGYTLFVEGTVASDATARLDALLRENPHYAECRDLGQLQPLRLFRIEAGGYETVIAREMADGKRLGDIKPGSLSTRTGWAEQFAGSYRDQGGEALLANDEPAEVGRGTPCAPS